jgi:hypothetical protein
MVREPAAVRGSNSRKCTRVGDRLIWVAAAFAGGAALSAPDWITAVIAALSAAASFLDLKPAPAEKLRHPDLEIAA